MSLEDEFGHTFYYDGSSPSGYDNYYRCDKCGVRKCNEDRVLGLCRGAPEPEHKEKPTMPCDSSHLNATAAEQNRQDAAKFLVFLHGKLKVPISGPSNYPGVTAYRRMAKHPYGLDEQRQGSDPDTPVIDLCDLMTRIEGSHTLHDRVFTKMNLLAYRELRDLVTWWDEHKAADKAKKKGKAK